MGNKVANPRRLWPQVLVLLCLLGTLAALFFSMSNAPLRVSTDDPMARDTPDEPDEAQSQASSPHPPDTTAQKEEPANQSALFGATAVDAPRAASTPGAERQPRALWKLTTNRLGDRNGAIIEGRVTVQGREAEGLIADIHVLQPDADAPVETTAFSEGSGFRFEQVPLGTAEIDVECTDGTGLRRHRRATVDVTSHRLYRIDLDFGPPASIAGKVRGIQAGESAGVLAFRGDYDVPTATVEDIYHLADVADAEARVREDGRYQLKGLEAGLYTVVAIADGRFGSAEEDEDPAMWFVVDRVNTGEDQIATLDLSLE